MYLPVAAFPGQHIPMTPWLYPSRVFGINHLGDSGYVHGRDVAFNHGPLGYLLYALPLGTNLVQGIAFRLAVHILFGAAFTYLAWKARSSPVVIVFVAAYVIAAAVGLKYEYYLVVVLSLLACVATMDHRSRILTIAAPSFVASLFLFMKFTSGFPSLLIPALCARALLFTKQLKSGLASLILRSAGLFRVAVLGTVLFGTVMT